MASRMLERARAAATGLDASSVRVPGQVSSSFIEVEEIEGALLWRPAGRLDAAACSQAAELFFSEVPDDSLLFVDLSRIEDMEPAGLGLFAAMQKRQRSRGADIVLIGIRPRQKRFIEAMGYGVFFTTALDMRCAIEYILGVGKDLFPLSTSCPACQARFGAAAPGRGRCRACNAVLTVMEDGRVELG
ncbi:MAG TPA: STAS domain-containing protein [Rectinemataceae bacterium]